MSENERLREALDLVREVRVYGHSRTRHGVTAKVPEDWDSRARAALAAPICQHLVINPNVVYACNRCDQCGKHFVRNDEATATINRSLAAPPDDAARIRLEAGCQIATMLGFATGHADSWDDLVEHLAEQVREEVECSVPSQCVRGPSPHTHHRMPAGPGAVTLPCLYCGTMHTFRSDSNEGRGVFNVFCPGGECEDRYAARQ